MQLGETSESSLQIPNEIFPPRGHLGGWRGVQIANRRTYWNESSEIISQIATDY